MCVFTDSPSAQTIPHSPHDADNSKSAIIKESLLEVVLAGVELKPVSFRPPNPKDWESVTTEECSLGVETLTPVCSLSLDAEDGEPPTIEQFLPRDRIRFDVPVLWHESLSLLKTEDCRSVLTTECLSVAVWKEIPVLPLAGLSLEARDCRSVGATQCLSVAVQKEIPVLPLAGLLSLEARDCRSVGATQCLSVAVQKEIPVLPLAGLLSLEARDCRSVGATQCLSVVVWKETPVPRRVALLWLESEDCKFLILTDFLSAAAFRSEILRFVSLLSLEAEDFPSKVTDESSPSAASSCEAVSTPLPAIFGTATVWLLGVSPVAGTAAEVSMYTSIAASLLFSGWTCLPSKPIQQTKGVHC